LVALFVGVNALFLSVLPSSHAATNPVQRAYDLFIPIGCSGGPLRDGLVVVGTGFPVSSTEVMTAGHVLCADGETTEVSLDSGQSWITVPTEAQRVFSDHDVAVLTILGGHTLPPAARFRAPRLGEIARSVGVPFRGLLLTRHVALVDPVHLSLDAFTVPGMSGSAFVGDDGYVIGMTTHATSAGYGYLTGGYQGVFLQGLLRDDR
jgi:S1-C subfamily serine protease